MRPRAIVYLRMKSASDGGRHAPFTEGYRPHFVVPPDGEYLGVMAVHCSGPVVPGEEATVDFELVYHPEVDYSALQVGSTFEWLHENPAGRTALNWLVGSSRREDRSFVTPIQTGVYRQRWHKSARRPYLKKHGHIVSRVRDYLHDVLFLQPEPCQAGDVVVGAGIQCWAQGQHFAADFTGADGVEVDHVAGLDGTGG
jgi:hypothetical protein